MMPDILLKNRKFGWANTYEIQQTEIYFNALDNKITSLNMTEEY